MKRMLLLALSLCLLLSPALADPYSELKPGVVCVTAQESIGLRSEPNYKLEPVCYLGPGLRIELLSFDEQSGWGHVFIPMIPPEDSFSGYVRIGSLMNGDYLSYNMCRVVNPNPGERLNLRSAPSPDADSLGSYYTGTLAVNYQQEKNGYLRVQIGFETGYMDKRYLVAYNSTDRSELPLTRIDNPDGSGANLRFSPATSAELLSFHPNGTEVVVMGASSNGWYHVMIDGVTGYVMESKLARPFSR